MNNQETLKSAAPSRMRKILYAGGWSLAGGLGSYVLRMGSSLVLTRLLVPEMFGVMAVAHMVEAILALLSDLGLRQAVIRSKRGDSPELLNTAWTIQVLRGSVIWAACLLISVGIYYGQQVSWLAGEIVYANSILPAVLAVTTFSSIIYSLRPTKWFIANRELDLKQLTKIELTAQVLSLLFTFALAWYTRSVWALVAGSLVRAALDLFLTSLWIPGNSNRFQWDSDCAHELISFGRWIMASSMLNVFASYGDRILLGAWISPASFAFYVLAMNLNDIINKLSGRLYSSTSLPALAEVAKNSRESFPRLFRKMRTPFDIVCIGSAGGLFALGQPLVDLMYDPRYAETGEIVRVLSFSIIFARYGLYGSAYLALGEPSRLSIVTFVRLVSMYTVVPAAYFLYGYTGALWAIALHRLPMLPAYYWINRRYALDKFFYEILVLAWWPVGYLCGLSIARLSGY